LLPAPQVLGDETTSELLDPGHCGWQEDAAMTKPMHLPDADATLLLFDVTALVSDNYRIFQLWIAPTKLNADGTWRTSTLTVISWTFLNRKEEVQF